MTVQPTDVPLPPDQIQQDLTNESKAMADWAPTNQAVLDAQAQLATAQAANIAAANAVVSESITMATDALSYCISNLKTIGADPVAVLQPVVAALLAAPTPAPAV